MNYLELISKFWNFNFSKRLGVTPTAFYLYLLVKGKEEDSLDFKISDIEISKILCLARKTIKTTREQLRILGLINCQTKNGLPCEYTIIPGYHIFSKSENLSKLKIEKQTQLTEEKITEVEPKIEIAKPKQVKSPIIKKTNPNPNIPTYDEFLEFAKTIKNYSSEINTKLEAKYDSWVENGWNNGYDKPITNWKSSLKNTLPYLIDSINKIDNHFKSLPTIHRPKQTYNE